MKDQATGQTRGRGPSRDRAGVGSIETLPSGRFKVRVWVGDKKVGDTFTTREEAERQRATLAVMHRAAAEARPDEDSLQRFGARWLDEQEKLGDLRSIDTLRSQWDCHLAGTPLAALSLEAIAESDVRAWLGAMVLKPALVATRGGERTHAPSGRKLSRDTVSKVLSQLRQILEGAREKGLLRANPARDVHVRGRRQRGNEVGTHLTLDELARLEASTEIPEAHRLVFLFAAYSGLRQGELWGLHWADVHLDGARPEVVVRFSHKGPPKNGRIRHVPLLGPAREFLTRWQAIAPASKEGLVFVTARGRRRRRSDDARWADYWAVKVRKQADGTRVRENVRQEGYSKRLGLGRPARFHDLRHTCASHLIMGTWGAQWSLSEIAAFLGHSDTEVTERYAHLSPDHLHGKAAQTAPRGTEHLSHATPGGDRKLPARPGRVELPTPRSVVWCSIH
ncbi:MAG: integrase [Myxococcaceae bacterium]|nr:integrase [Myxococcaceae bacterium]